MERLALQAEHRALVEAQRRAEVVRAVYQDLYDFAMVGLASLDLGGLIWNLNATAAAMLGRTVHHLAGRPMAGVIVGSDHGRWVRFLRGMAANDGERRAEFRIRKNGDSEIILEFTALRQRVGKAGSDRLHLALRDVTAQRQAEAAARAAQNDLRFVADCAPVIITRCGRDLRYRYVNEAGARFLQMPRDKIVGRPMTEIVGDAVMEATSPFVERVLRGETVEYERELSYRRAGPRFVHAIYQPEHDERGRVKGWLAAITDITEKKRAEMALRESESRFRLMADSAPVLVWLAGPDMLRTYFNKPWLDFTGRTIQQELGWGWAEAVHRDDSTRCLTVYTEAFERKTEFQMEYRLRRRDGEYRWLQVHGVPRFGDEGEFVGYIGSCVDVTERKEREQDLREARDLLARRVERRTVELRTEVTVRRDAQRLSAQLAAIVKSSPDAIIGYDLQGRVTSWNDGALRLYGYREEEMLGRPQRFPSESASYFASALHDIRLGRTVEPVETDCVAKDGRRVAVFLRLSPVKDESGQVVGVSHVARDISDRRRLEREVLSISEREQRRIAQDLHDSLGQQLAGLRILGALLQKKLAQDKSPRLGEAETISRLLSEIAGEARCLARGLHPVEDDDRGLLLALEHLSQRVSETYEIRCVLRCSAPVLVRNNAAATHLYRIAQEAIHNAVRHGRAQRIEIALSSTPKQIRLAIRDNGDGIGAKRTRRHGLGWRIMNYRAQMFGGTVQVTARRSGGTQVLCLCPKE